MVAQRIAGLARWRLPFLALLLVLNPLWGQ